VKIRGGVGEISIPIVEALLTTEPPAAERGGLIKKKGKNVHTENLRPPN